MSQLTPVEVAAEVTGDEIIAAGIFESKGAALKRGLGGAAGSAVGGAGGNVGELIGATVGARAGVEAGREDGVYEFFIAVSLTKVYVMVPTELGRFQQREIRHGDVKVVHAFDRDSLEVTIKARVTVRTVVLEDLASGDQLSFEGRRLGWSHSKEVVKALVGHDLQDAEEPSATTQTPSPS